MSNKSLSFFSWIIFKNLIWLSNFSSPLFPLLLFCASMLDELVMDVKFDCDVLVGDFCSILIIVGVPAVNDAVASKLFDVVTSDTWHGSRLICRSVPCVVDPSALCKFVAKCWTVEFHAIGNVRLHPVPSSFDASQVVVLLWCCWCKFKMQSLMFLLAFDAFDELRLPLFELVVGVVFVDATDDDEVELPELIFSALMAGAVADGVVVVKLVTGKCIWSGSISDVSHLPISDGFRTDDDDEDDNDGVVWMADADVVQLRKSAAVCDCTKMLLFAYFFYKKNLL